MPTMRTVSPFKLFSWILLAVLLAVTVQGACEFVFATHHHAATAEYSAATPAISAPHLCPYPPLEQHDDSDSCHDCINCTCHAPLAIQPLHLAYTPIVSDLTLPEPFKHFPEVYLPKFIPPHNLA